MNETGRTIASGILLQGRNRWIPGCVILLSGLTIGTDLLEAAFQHSGFYWSESLLFASFWVLFFPFLKLQFHFIKKEGPLWLNFLLAAGMVVAHLVVFPAIVWLLSAAFFYHTFAYRQSFEFGISEHLVKILLLYATPVVLCYFQRPHPATNEQPVVASETTPVYLKTLLVSDTHNRKISIRTEEILYFSAHSPYVAIYHPDKKYLCTETLRALSTQLDGTRFVRIHKSCIVNLAYVAASQSRLNGDYDITLKEGTVLRLSRNYAPAFKAIFENGHRVG